MLEKRLEAHMNELAAYYSDGTGSKKQGHADANRPSVEHQGEKERVIAKAALTVAELGVSPFSFSFHDNVLILEQARYSMRDLAILTEEPQLMHLQRPRAPILSHFVLSLP